MTVYLSQLLVLRSIRLKPGALRPKPTPRALNIGRTRELSEGCLIFLKAISSNPQRGLSFPECEGTSVSSVL